MIKKVFLSFLLLMCSSTGAFSQSVPDLMKQGQNLLDQNRMEEAVTCYEKILVLDACHYEALVFLCNYHFLLGQKAMEQVESTYKNMENPNRMQFALQLDEQKKVYTDYWEKAEQYLIKAYLIHRNDHLDDLAGRIADFKIKIGITTPIAKKPFFRRR